MMPDYHIGTLDAPSKKLLESGGGGEEVDSAEDSSPRAIFLHPKQWRRANMTAKTIISSDSKIFTFTLDHTTQEIGLPTGQHVMLRLRDPVTREAIIRAYTPYSDAATARGQLDVLIKLYRASADRTYAGGAMTTALDALPLGHWVEFKGPVGKFEYLGQGKCTVGGRARFVRRFIMVCAGSGITPIFSVLRAVLQDPRDETFCTVLDGNRTEEDILCRAELDAFAEAAAAAAAEDREGGGGRCRIVHTLSLPGPDWKGGRGRMDRALFEREVGPPRSRREAEGEGGGGAAGEREEMVLVCGPEPLEKSVREIFGEMGWKAEDLLFF